MGTLALNIQQTQKLSISNSSIGQFLSAIRYVYLFTCRTTGEEVINKMALENRQAGLDREEIKWADLQEAIAQTVYNSNTSKYLLQFQ